MRFFYVIGGKGLALVDAKEVPIESGDVVFVPRGHDHRIKNSESQEPLELVFLLDKAGLTRPCPEVDRLIQQGNVPHTTEEINRISRLHPAAAKQRERRG